MYATPPANSAKRATITTDAASVDIWGSTDVSMISFLFAFRVERDFCVAKALHPHVIKAVSRLRKRRRGRLLLQVLGGPVMGEWPTERDRGVCCRIVRGCLLSEFSGRPALRRRPLRFPAMVNWSHWATARLPPLPPIDSAKCMVRSGDWSFGENRGAVFPRTLAVGPSRVAG
jgi:hypothetical protein